MGPYGGQIMVGNWTIGWSGIKVPKGALQDSVLITFDYVNTGDITSTIGSTEFGPHGLQFQKRVFIFISYREADLAGVDESKIKIYYINEETGQWEPISSAVDTRRKVVIGWTRHFSRYALAAE